MCVELLVSACLVQAGPHLAGGCKRPKDQTPACPDKCSCVAMQTQVLTLGQTITPLGALLLTVVPITNTSAVTASVQVCTLIKVFLSLV